MDLLLCDAFDHRDNDVTSFNSVAIDSNTRASEVPAPGFYHIRRHLWTLCLPLAELDFGQNGAGPFSGSGPAL